MSKVLKYGEVSAVCVAHPDYSEVLFFQRNNGLVGKIKLQEKGQVLEDRLNHSMLRVALRGEMCTCPRLQTPDLQMKARHARLGCE